MKTEFERRKFAKNVVKESGIQEPNKMECQIPIDVLLIH